MKKVFLLLLLILSPLYPLSAQSDGMTLRVYDMAYAVCWFVHGMGFEIHVSGPAFSAMLLEFDE